MRYHAIPLVAISLLLMLSTTSISSGAINAEHVGVSNGDSFTLEVVEMGGLLTQFEDEVLTMDDYELWANESVTITVTDTNLVNDSVAADVTIHSGTKNTLIPLGFFGSPIVHTNWGLWVSEVVTLKNTVQELLPELSGSADLGVSIPEMTFDVELDQGEKLVSAHLTGSDGEGSEMTLDITYKKETGVLNEIVFDAFIKTDFVDVPASATIQNTDYVEPSTDKDNAPGFGLILAFTSLFALIPLIRKRI